MNLLPALHSPNLRLGRRPGSYRRTIATHLAGKVDVSRITLTFGQISAKDIFDNNAYANDPRTQFMNWALMANEAWDYPATASAQTGLAAGT